MHINEPYTVKRELSFQQAICYLGFRWVNILHAWTENSVNRLVKNPKTNCPCIHTVKRELPFHKPFGDSYLSFRWVNILHAWTVNFVNRFVKNPIIFAPKPDLDPFASQAISQECQNYFFASQMPDYTCLWCRWVNFRFGWKGNYCNVFWILSQSVCRIYCPCM